MVQRLKEIKSRDESRESREEIEGGDQRTEVRGEKLECGWRNKK